MSEEDYTIEDSKDVKHTQKDAVKLLRELAIKDHDQLMLLAYMLKNKDMIKLMTPYLNLPKGLSRLYSMFSTNPPLGLQLIQEQHYLQVARILFAYYKRHFSSKRMEKTDQYVNDTILSAFRLLGDSQVSGKELAEKLKDLTEIMSEECVMMAFLGFMISRAQTSKQVLALFHNTGGRFYHFLPKDLLSLRSGLSTWMRHTCDPGIEKLLKTDFRPKIIERRIADMPIREAARAQQLREEERRQQMILDEAMAQQADQGFGGGGDFPGFAVDFGAQ